jgi:hypothetical protein
MVSGEAEQANDYGGGWLDARRVLEGGNTATRR